jgi:hypothetical protein
MAAWPRRDALSLRPFADRGLWRRLGLDDRSPPWASPQGFRDPMPSIGAPFAGEQLPQEQHHNLSKPVRTVQVDLRQACFQLPFLNACISRDTRAHPTDVARGSPSALPRERSDLTLHLEWRDRCLRDVESLTRAIARLARINETKYRSPSH